jgi:hypothetical protein
MKKPKIVFARLPKWTHGECDGETITIDLRKQANPGHTALHELFHFFHPDWSESKVIRETAKQWKALSQYDRLRFYRKIFDVWEGK